MRNVVGIQKLSPRPARAVAPLLNVSFGARQARLLWSQFGLEAVMQQRGGNLPALARPRRSRPIVLKNSLDQREQLSGQKFVLLSVGLDAQKGVLITEKNGCSENFGLFGST